MALRQATKIGLTVVLWLVAQNAQAKDEWIKVKSANFELISNAGEKETKQTAFKLEQFRYLFSQLFPKQQLNSPSATQVVVFKNVKTFKPFMPLYQGKTKQVAGYFQPGHDKNFISINLGALSEKPYEVIFHEYIHLLLSYNLQSFPLWFEEGLAEFYSNCEIDEKDVALGKFHESHIYTLRQSKFIPLESLFQVDHRSPFYNEREKTGIFYAESWAFIHYLILGKPPEGQKQLSKFIALLAAGRDHTEAFKQAFSTDFKPMQKELQNYIGSNSFKFYRFKLKSIDVDKDFSVSALRPAEVQYHLGDLLLHAQRFDEAKTYLQKALEADANFAPAYESLGLGYLRKDDFAEAKRYLKSAVERDSQNHLAYYYYTRTLMQEISVRGGAINSIPEETAAAMMDALRKTVSLAPNFADAYELLAVIYLLRGTDVDEGIGFLNRAMALNPGRHEFGLTLAQLYIRKQDFARAKEVLSRTAKMTKDEGLRARSEQLLQTVEKLLSYSAQATRARQESDTDIRPRDNPKVAAVEQRPAETPQPPRATGSSATRVGKKISLPVPEETISVKGVLVAMECPASGLDFIVRGEERSFTFHADSPESVLLYQSGKIVQRDFSCGPQALEVIARYIPHKNIRSKPPGDGKLVSLSLLTK